jgi:hypothetical protein
MLALVFVAAGCKKNELFISDIKEKVEIGYALRIDSLKGLVNINSEINQVLSYKNNLLLFDHRNKTAYLSDMKFRITKKFELAKDYEKLFTGKITDVFILRDTLFIGDDTYTIKKLDLTTGRIKSLPLKINLFQNFPFTLTVNADGVITTSFGCMANSVKDKVKGDFVWGSVFDPNGQQIQALGSAKDLFGHNYLGSETAYYSESDNNKYVCFAYSKNILQLAPTENQHQLYTNKEWTAPNIGKRKTLSAFIMNYQKLVKYKKYFLIPALPEKTGAPARIVVYDLEFNPVKVVELKEVQESYWYYITVSGDNMILYHKDSNTDRAFYLFDLSKLGL